MKPPAVDDGELDEKLSRYLRTIMNAPLRTGVRLNAADLRELPRRRLARQILSGAMVVAAAAAASILVLATHRPSTPTGGSATPPPLSATLVLSKTTIRAGGAILGEIVVENRTGHAVMTSGCHGIFGVVLTSSTYHPIVSFPLCLESITIPAGRSSYRVDVPATYNTCSMLGASDPRPACLPTGMPPLPPGAYEATTFESGNAIPLPSAIAVTVTP